MRSVLLIDTINRIALTLCLRKRTQFTAITIDFHQ